MEIVNIALAWQEALSGQLVLTNPRGNLKGRGGGLLKVEGEYQGIDMGGDTGELLGHPCNHVSGGGMQLAGPQRRLIH